MIVLQSVNRYKLFNCRANDAGRRLDRVIKKMLPDVPAGLIYSGIRKGLIRVNDKKINLSYRIAENDVIQVNESINFVPETKNTVQNSSELAERLERMIILRTDNLVFLNKPAGMLTHGPDSLAEIISGGLSGIDESLSFTPAPLHRLDRNTSGLLAVSLTISGATRFSRLMREHRISKYYIGICLNGPQVSRRIENTLVRNNKKTSVGSETAPAGRRAVTTVEPLLHSGSFSLCLFRIETGLTHQIRAQAAAAGFPLAGDAKYGGRTPGFGGYFLHSWAMNLPAYDETCGFRSVTAELPPRALQKAAGIFGTGAVPEALKSAAKKLQK